MTNIKINYLWLGEKDIPSLLSLLGFPTVSRMHGEDWKQFYEEVSCFVKEEEALEIERTLLGERVYDKRLF